MFTNTKKVLALLFFLASITMFVGCQEQESVLTPDINKTNLAKFSLPQGATLTSAILHIYIGSGGNNNESVNIYGISSDWTETGVTWNTKPTTYSTVEGNFTTDAEGWKTVEITGLVNKWLNGTIPNYGLLLDQVDEDQTRGWYYSREETEPYEPFIEVVFSSGSADIPDIADASIIALVPDFNENGEFLYTGYVANSEKQSLIKFDIEPTQCQNKIGDFVWHDKNVNGIQDTGEPGIADVIIELLKDGVVNQTATTDENGIYEFTGLENGNYCVRVAASNYEVGGVLYSTTQTKWYATKKNQGADDTKDSDAGKNESVCVDLNCNENVTLDFGFYKTCVSVTKLANKQTAKPGETITYTFIVENCGDITLGGGVDLFDAVLNPTAPHKIGNLTPVYPGTTKTLTKTYCVKTTDCGDLVNTVKAVGHPVDGSPNVEFTASVSVEIECLSSLGDKVWFDCDKDGIQDYGEDGFKNVKVELYNCSTGQLIATKYSDYYGKYYFSNLTSGDYKLKFYAPSGYSFANKDQGSNDQKDSDVDPSTGFTTCITLGEGITDLKWDAGLIKLPPSKLGNFVWKDKDKDGIQDSDEYGLKNVKVKLYDCNGNFIAYTYTDYYGKYYFNNLTAGSYKIKYVAPYGYAFTKKDQGTNDNYDSDVDQTTGYTTCITLGSGVNDYKWDAGLYYIYK